jgi:hypothetical protein
MKCLYKYPRAAYPYADLVETNRRRARNEFEYASSSTLESLRAAAILMCS